MGDVLNPDAGHVVGLLHRAGHITDPQLDAACALATAWREIAEGNGTGLPATSATYVLAEIRRRGTRVDCGTGARGMRIDPDYDDDAPDGAADTAAPLDRAQDNETPLERMLRRFPDTGMSAEFSIALARWMVDDSEPPTRTCGPAGWNGRTAWALLDAVCLTGGPIPPGATLETLRHALDLAAVAFDESTWGVVSAAVNGRCSYPGTTARFNTINYRGRVRAAEFNPATPTTAAVRHMPVR